MTERRRVAVLFGGPSPEHEVSVSSARGLVDGFDRSRTEPVPIAISRDGSWCSPTDSARWLSEGRVGVPDDSASRSASVCVVPGQGFARQASDGRVEPLAIDVAFPIVHGARGEDGSLQGLLDWAGIPYVGADVRGSAIAMDKAVSKALVDRAGVAVVEWVELRSPHADGALERVATTLGFPAFVKPANGGSSVGVTRVSDRDGLARALDVAFGFDSKVIVERAVDAREIECAVLGNREPKASVPGEIVPGADFYTYDDKYKDGKARTVVPAPLAPELSDRVRRSAERVYETLDLRGLARVDFFVEKQNDRLYFNEVNTLPGFTPISMYSKMWEASGLPYPELLERLVDLALERARQAPGPGAMPPRRRA